MNNPDYFQNLEDLVGKRVVYLILKYVRQYKLKETDAEELARHLENKLPDDDRDISGKFCSNRKRNDYNFEKAVKCIFSDWFEKSVVIDKETTISSIVEALESSRMNNLAAEIQQENGAVDTEDPMQSSSEGGIRRRANSISANQENLRNIPMKEIQITNTMPRQSADYYVGVEEYDGEAVKLLRAAVESNEPDGPLISRVSYIVDMGDSDNANKDPTRKTSCQTSFRVLLCVFVIGMFFGTFVGDLMPWNARKVEEITPPNTISYKYDHEGKFLEFRNKCQVSQSPIPPLPVKLEGCAHDYIKDVGVLVCGGKVPGGDHDPKLCYLHELNSDRWDPFPHSLTTNRIYSYGEYDLASNIFSIIGGESSDPCKPLYWYPSLDILNISSLSDGWRKKKSDDDIDLHFSEQQQILKLPCN